MYNETSYGWMVKLESDTASLIEKSSRLTREELDKEWNTCVASWYLQRDLADLHGWNPYIYGNIAHNIDRNLKILKRILENKDISKSSRYIGYAAEVSGYVDAFLSIFGVSPIFGSIVTVISGINRLMNKVYSSGKTQPLLTGYVDTYQHYKYNIDNASINNSWLEHKIKSDGRIGMVINTMFSVYNITGNYRVLVSFYDKDKYLLVDRNGYYCSNKGFVITYSEETNIMHSNLSLRLFMTYQELHLPVGTHHCYFKVQLVSSGSDGRIICETNYYYFRITRNYQLIV